MRTETLGINICQTYSDVIIKWETDMKSLQELLDNSRLVGDCFEWQRCFNSDGYPRVVWEGNNNTKVHRLVYSLAYGKCIKGLVVRHTCDNTKCINPSHLVVGSPADNVRDRVIRGRSYNHVSSKEESGVRQLRKDGHSYRKIAELMCISRKRVEYILTKKRQ